MIKVDNLIRWIRNHAVSKSILVPNGWMRGKELLELAQDVQAKEPFDYLPTVDTEE